MGIKDGKLGIGMRPRQNPMSTLVSTDDLTTVSKILARS